MTFEEREIKFLIQDLPALAERLHRCGATLSRKRTLERNLLLDTADQHLRNTGRLLRLRQDDRARVTFKEKTQVENGIRTRTEIEITVDSFAVAHKLFEGLGYRVTMIYEKFRHVYNMGDVEVTLDELPFGNFVEIEAPNDTMIEGVSQMLGLDWSKGIGINYLGLFGIAREKLGFTFNDLTFDNFQALEVSPGDLGVEPADV